ncbi:MAG TPA: trypsin-like peptidase domain-containing protein [Treponemataceae bacterium]|nr:trypsin-like peptidase domain-containing protein [Treponemataceae bacterium]
MTYLKNKKNLVIYIILCVLLCISQIKINAQTILAPEILEKIQASVFEVIVEKPSEGNLEYEKSLPFSRMAFAIRNDKYLPLGTAFLMNDGSFFSASHVFKLYEKTVYTNYYIRDRNGKIYKIDSITRLSTNRDYISFTVEAFTAENKAGLEYTKDIALNSTVFSVGNALGEGIVIRNGVLTSQTYEIVNGEWKWLRFSAAASPGNSGGPLINSDGEVIGIITMKSENENLNYALPFSEVYALPASEAYLFQAIYYSLPNILSEKFYHKISTTISLPAKLTEVQKKLTDYLNNYYKEIVLSLRKQFSPTGKKGFAFSSGWEEMLNHDYLPNFPYVIYLPENNTWTYASPSNISDYKLENNGSVSYGSMMGYRMGLIKKPDSIALEDLLLQPELYMKYLLAASPIYRNLAGENIAITSLGKPSKSETYTDYFERTWLVNLWDLPFADCMLISYALPLPEGMFVMYCHNTTGIITGSITLDIAFLADFVYPPYKTNVKNIEEFLALSEQLVGKKPPFLQEISLQRNNTAFHFYNGSFGLNLSFDIFPIEDETYFSLTNGFTFNKNKLKIDNRSFALYSNSRLENYRYIFVGEKIKPADTSLKKSLDQWNQKLNRISPYNRQAYSYENYTYLDQTIYPKEIEYDTRKNADSLYVFALELDGQDRTEDILDFAEKVEKILIFD